MLFLYGLLFFLLGTFVTAQPDQTPVFSTGSPTPRPVHPPYTEIEGWWVLKRPHPRQSYCLDKILNVRKGEFHIYSTGKALHPVVTRTTLKTFKDKALLAGVWHPLPTTATHPELRYEELSISDGGKGFTLIPTESSSMLNINRMPDLPNHRQLVRKDEADGYWILGDLLPQMPPGGWYDILHIEGRTFKIFKLDDNLSVVPGSLRATRNPLPGDYYRIPTDKMSRATRFAIFQVRYEGLGALTAAITYH